MSVRLGIVGVGDVARRDYLPELSRLAGRAELTWVCSRGPERASAVAEAYAVPRWTTDYRELVSAPDVDAVLNLTPFSLHAEVTLAALEAGKHVYSEKPVASDGSQAATIAAAAAERGLLVVPAPSVMLFPQLRRAREIVEAGSLGRICSARAHAFGGVPPWSGYTSDPTPFFAADAGPLVDMGVYALHALTGLLGSVRGVTASSARTRDSFLITDGPFAERRVPVEVDDCWHLVLELEGGCLASVEANNCVAGSLSPALELQGERATLGLDLIDVSAPISLLVDGEITREVAPHERAQGPDHLLGVEHLVDCVETGRRPLLTLAHAIHVVDVIDAARSAAVERRAVRVRSTVGVSAAGVDA